MKQKLFLVTLMLLTALPLFGVHPFNKSISGSNPSKIDRLKVWSHEKWKQGKDDYASKKYKQHITGELPIDDPEWLAELALCMYRNSITPQFEQTKELMDKMKKAKYDFGQNYYKPWIVNNLHLSNSKVSQFWNKLYQINQNLNNVTPNIEKDEAGQEYLLVTSTNEGFLNALNKLAKDHFNDHKLFYVNHKYLPQSPDILLDAILKSVRLNQENVLTVTKVTDLVQYTIVKIPKEKIELPKADGKLQTVKQWVMPKNTAYIAEYYQDLLTKELGLIDFPTPKSFWKRHPYITATLIGLGTGALLKYTKHGRAFFKTAKDKGASFYRRAYRSRA